MSISIYLNCTNYTLFSCHFPINGKHLLRGGLPMKALRLRSSRCLQALAALEIQQNLAHPALDIEDIIGAHQFSSLPHGFHQRRQIGCNHRSAASHGFERSQTEALIQSRESEGLCGAVKNPQSLNRNESQKTDHV